MKSLLIRPPYKRLQGYHPEPYFPLGIGYIGAVMEKDGHDVKIWNDDMMTDITAGVMPDEVVMFKERQKRFEIYQNALNKDNHPVWQEILVGPG